MYCNGWLLMNEAALGGNIFHIIFSTVDLLSELNKNKQKTLLLINSVKDLVYHQYTQWCVSCSVMSR